MSGNRLSFIQDLTPARDFWDMKAKVIRLWKQSYRWDMILLDEKGHKIQACVKSHLVPEFASDLREDVVLVIRKFGVGQQGDRHRIIDLGHKINFFRCTSLQIVSDFNGDYYGFDFKPFNEILSNNLRAALTVDVIGRVSSCGDLDIFRSGGRECKRFHFELQDLDDRVVKCTLWNSYADQLNNFVTSNQSTEIVLIAIQHGRIKDWQGYNTIQNDMYGTRLFINEDISEFNDLRRRMILKDGGSSSTVLSSQTVYPMRNEFVVNHPLKHVDELLDIKNELTCVVVATIKIIEENAGWFYTACRKCDKIAMTKTVYLENAVEIPSNFIDAPIDSLWCLKCRGIATSLIPKYRVQVRVQDSTGTISFVMFDTDVFKIVGVSANEVRDRQLRSGNMDVFPHELAVMKNKIFAFKVNITKYNFLKKSCVYTVRKLCDDQQIIAELQANDHADEEEGDQNPNEVEQLSSKNDEFSELPTDSKDAVSYTDDSVAVDLSKNSLRSPAGIKRNTEFLDEVNDDQGSTTRSLKKKFQPLEGATGLGDDVV